MAFTIVSWNIEENQDWWVKLSDTGSTILVQVFESLADAQAGTNVCGSYTSEGYGNQYAVLEAGPGLPDGFGYFQTDFVWHLLVNGANGDASVIYKVARFCELSPISDPVYRNVDLISARGVYEINLHTSVNYKYVISYPGVLDLEAGDIVYVNSVRLGAFLAQVSSISLAGTAASLKTSVYLERYATIQKE